MMMEMMSGMNASERKMKLMDGMSSEERMRMRGMMGGPSPAERAMMMRMMGRMSPAERRLMMKRMGGRMMDSARRPMSGKRMDGQTFVYPAILAAWPARSREVANTVIAK